MTHTAIIGAGAAGLFAAKRLSTQKGQQITIFEKSSKVGTKLRASGGGRANILNTSILPSHYNNAEFMDSVLKRASYATLRDEFAKMGLLLTADEEGRVYPATLFAATVVNVLLEQLGDNVSIACDTPVLSLTPDHGKWKINNEKKLFDRVILASGSPAGMIPKNQAGYNNYLSDLQLNRKKLTPSLTGFTLHHYPSFLFGCRVRAEVSLLQENHLIFKEKGEVIFKEDGISGIVILNCSAYYNRLSNKKNCQLSLNLLPDDTVTDIKKQLEKFGSLSGILHPKLCKWHEKKPFDPRNLSWEIKDTYGIEFAQVCSGGICIDELDNNFHLKRFPGLQAIGEMVDIDGVCGGYNLFFAFASAYLATQI